MLATTLRQDGFEADRNGVLRGGRFDLRAGFCAAGGAIRKWCFGRRRFELFSQLRRYADIPELFLSARGTRRAGCGGWGLGADDYITKPFLPQELTLRLCAVYAALMP
jgi:CheY-like chemotaxis protein